MKSFGPTWLNGMAAMRYDLGRQVRFFVLALLLCAGVPGSVLADFYPKDFAKEPGGSTRESPELSVPPGVKNLSPILPKDFVEKSSGERVLEFGVLVNISDADGVLSTLDQSIRSVANAKPGPIAIAGAAPGAQLSGRLSGFKARGARLVTPGGSIFAGASVSPTWIVGTASGYHMLEGLSDPMQFVNSQGEFVSPDSVKPEPPAPMDTEAF